MQVGVGGSSIERFVPPNAREAALGPPLTPEGSPINSTYNTMVRSIFHDAFRLHLCLLTSRPLDSPVLAPLCAFMSLAYVWGLPSGNPQ